MLIVDDLVTAPVKGILWVFEKIHQAAEEEIENRRARTRAELSELYMQLETGKITEEEFDAREKKLLARLDQIKAMQEGKAASPGRGEHQERK
jgi:hypothetical protein